MLDLKRFKEAVTSCGRHLPTGRQMLKSWATRNTIIPQDWEDLVTKVTKSVMMENIVERGS